MRITDIDNELKEILFDLRFEWMIRNLSIDQYAYNIKFPNKTFHVYFIEPFLPKVPQITVAFAIIKRNNEDFLLIDWQPGHVSKPDYQKVLTENTKVKWEIKK